MSTDTLEHVDTDTTEQTDEDEPLLAHLFWKKDLESLIGNFTPIRALCGYVHIPLLSGEGLEVCKPCRAIYEGLEP